MSDALHVELLLRRALAPVEPPADLAQRLQGTLQNISDMAVDELENWELAAMRDPRNWVRPVAAALVGASAGTALVALRVRARHRTRRQQSDSALDLTRRTIHDAAYEARRLFGSR